MRSKRLYQIDLMRFLAAFTVLMFHYSYRGYISGMCDLEYPILSKIFKYGFFGVNLFFMISGFVILMSIQSGSLKKFIKSRIIRLYPVYWCCLLVTFLAILFFGYPRFEVSFHQLLHNITMFNGFYGVKSVDGVYWSLHVELLFYFLIVMFLILNKIIKVKDDIFIIFWLIISFAPVFINVDSIFILRVARFFFIFEYSSFFIAGMLFFKILKTNQLKYKLYLIPTMFLSLRYCWFISREMSIEYNSEFSLSIIIAIISFFYLIFYLISTNRFEKWNKVYFLKLGLLTYPLYLIHQVLGFILFKNLENYINKYLILFSVIVLMLFLSKIINEKFEIPISNFLKKVISIKSFNLKVKKSLL